MSISAMLVALPTAKADLVVGNGGRVAGRIAFGGTAMGTTGLVVECSSRPQKKATAHHRKTRPKKSQPWDVRRKGPTPYPPLPALPPEWTLLSGQEGEQQQQPQQGEVVTSSSPSSSSSSST